MELRHLRYFVAVGEEQHYGRASRRLRVAQPALSRQIQDLEEEVGFKLFDRLPRGVKLSAAGVLFAQADGPASAVSIDNFTFVPQPLTVKVGTTVTWTNKDDIPHGIASA